MSVSAVRVRLGPSQPSAYEAWVDEAGNLVIPAAALPGDGRGSTRVHLGQVHGVDAGSPPVPRGLLVVAATSALLVAVTATFAIYGHQWHWTGFAGATSLWSWLRLLVQPLALAFLVVHLLTGSLRVGRTTCLVGAFLLAVLIVAGYGERWSWTGFPGRHLWDWLTLLLFPIVAIALPEWIRRGEPFGGRGRVVALAVLGAFALLVAGGYHWRWTWTGFTGNTFRDWLDLMIAPFLLPVALKVVHARHVARSASHRAASPDDLIVEISSAR